MEKFIIESKDVELNLKVLNDYFSIWMKPELSIPFFEKEEYIKIQIDEWKKEKATVLLSKHILINFKSKCFSEEFVQEIKRKSDPADDNIQNLVNEWVKGDDKYKKDIEKGIELIPRDDKIRKMKTILKWDLIPYWKEVKEKLEKQVKDYLESKVEPKIDFVVDYFK